MIKTKVREPQLAFPEDHSVDHLPEPVVEPTPEQIAALAEAEKRDRERQREWASTIQALKDESTAVFRAMRRFRHEGEQDQIDPVIASFEDGRFLIDRMGAECVLDSCAPTALPSSILGFPATMSRACGKTIEPRIRIK
jgi:hypothetical protein